MKKHKTKGSSMLFVLIVFGIISILGVSIMGVAYSNYSSRIAQNNKVKDLYSAESGLDMAYIKLCNEVQNGINEGVGAVNILLAEGKIASIEEQNTKLQEVYAKYIKNNMMASVTGTYMISTGEADIKCILYDKDNKSKILTDESTDKIAVLTSTFSDSDGNERSVKVSYTLLMPKNVIDMSQSAGSLTALTSYSIATDENMEISGSGNVTLNGDVWIKGVRSNYSEISTNPLEKKYSGGLVVDKSGTSNTVTFTGNLTTNTNILIKSGQVELKNNMTAFAENLYLGSLDSSEDKDNRTSFAGGDLYLANDLVIADSDAKVSLKNLYAFNDLNTSTLKSTNGKVARESSSIIINSLKWPNKNGKIEVLDSAYIMGLAYIKTNTSPYQTGESVAYKGNYQAYTNNIESDLTDGIYTYLDPLVLITHDNSGNELNAVQKTSRFIKYSESEPEKIRTDGIALPIGKTYTAGAYISNDLVVKNTNLTESVINEISEMKRQYINTVNYMGKEKILSGSSTDTLNSAFLEEPKSTVENQVNWDGVNRLISYKGNIFEESGTVFILNNDSNMQVTVEGTTVKLGGRYSVPLTDSKKYIIVTSGKVVVNSSVNYNGVIMARKNITVKSSGKVGYDGGIDALYKNAGQSVKELMNTIFSDGDTVVTTQAITSKDIIQKEKWSIEK